MAKAKTFKMPENLPKSKAELSVLIEDLKADFLDSSARVEELKAQGLELRAAYEKVEGNQFSFLGAEENGSPKRGPKGKRSRSSKEEAAQNLDAIRTAMKGTSKGKG